MLDLSKVVLNLGGYGNVLSSTLQPGYWAHALRSRRETVKVPGGNGISEQECETFGLEKKYKLYVRERANYTRHSKKKTKHHINWTKHAIYFSKSGLRGDEMIRTLDYHISRLFLPGCPSNTIAVTEIPDLSFAETVFDLHKTVAGCKRRPKLRLQQKSFDMKRHAIRPLSSQRPVVLDS